MYTVTPMTMSLKCQGAPFALATRVTLSPSSAASTDGSPSTTGPGAPSTVASTVAPGAPWTTPAEARAGAATGTAALFLEGAVRTRRHVGHSPSAASSGGFQNLLQSSHHGNGAALHGHQAR